MVNFHIKYQTHFETAAKYFLLLLVLLSYFFYLSYHHDFSKGGVVAALSWSFFVLCTPVADAGFLLDFPIRLIFGWRMFYTEIVVWVLAFIICISTLVFFPHFYETTLLTRVFKKILVTPNPYWIIILLCCIGTFASIYFGDEMMDVIGHHQRKTHHKHLFKYKALVLVSVTLLVVVIYYELMQEFGIAFS